MRMCGGLESLCVAAAAGEKRERKQGHCRNEKSGTLQSRNRGSRLTFLLASTGATAKLEVAPGGVRRAIMNYRLRLLRMCSTLAAASTCNCTAAKGGSVVGISCAAHHNITQHNLNSDGWRIDLDGGWRVSRLVHTTPAVPQDAGRRRPTPCD